MLPLLSSMHLVKFSAAPAQLVLYWFWLLAMLACWGAASAGALEPPKSPPRAWPIVEPTATPLWGVLVLSCFLPPAPIGLGRRGRVRMGYVRCGAGHLPEKTRARGGCGRGGCGCLGGLGWGVCAGRASLLLRGCSAGRDSWAGGSTASGSLTRHFVRCFVWFYS